MNAADDYKFEASKRDLADGILKQAALDLRRFQGATSGVEREFYLDAYRWIVSDDCSWPFSFLNVCQLLNLAPGSVIRHFRLLEPTLRTRRAQVSDFSQSRFHKQTHRKRGWGWRVSPCRALNEKARPRKINEIVT